MTQFYIGCKQVEAREQEKGGKPGYAVKYPDGYTSWSPRATFLAAYLPMGTRPSGRTSDGEPVQPVLNEDRITSSMASAFIASMEYSKLGEKTTVGCAKLANGFEIVESSSCVDARNYSDDIGRQMVLTRIHDRVFQLLGFLLQTARNGVKTQPVASA